MRSLKLNLFVACTLLSFRADAELKGSLVRAGRGFAKICAAAISNRTPAGLGPLVTNWQGVHTFPGAGLITSVAGEDNYEAKTWGTIPPEISGVLYQNGAGAFGQGNERNRSMIDADGMIRRAEIRNGRVHFINRMVQTEKWRLEQAAGRKKKPSWTTLSSRYWENVGFKPLLSEAAVTVLRIEGRLFAFDELQEPYELDPVTLETIGQVNLDHTRKRAIYNAHFKIEDGGNRITMFSNEPGRHVTINITEFDRALNVTRRYPPMQSPRDVLLHDMSITENYFIFILHPVFFNMKELLKVPIGMQTIAQTLDYRPAEKNLVWVVNRHNPDFQFQFLADKSIFVWHALNAFETPGGIQLTFNGSETFNGVSGTDSNFEKVMMGHLPPPDPADSGVYRYSIDLTRARMTESVVNTDGAYEFPTVNPALLGRPNRYGYFCRRTANDHFFTSVVRMDIKTGKTSGRPLGPGHYVMEPIFIPKPGHVYDGETEPGWVIALVYDSSLGKSYYAIFDAEDMDRGPIGKAYLRDPIPMNFHGMWYPEP